jgi:hypothetical protein
MDVNGSNTGGCRLGSAYLVYDLVDGFCDNSSGRLFCVEETANFLTISATTRLSRKTVLHGTIYCLEIRFLPHSVSLLMSLPIYSELSSKYF